MKAQNFYSGAILLLAACLTSSSTQASDNPWYNQYVLYEATGYDNYWDSSDAAILAWQESLLLRSYLNLYEATKAESWLSTFITHFDKVRAKASDPDGDGYDSWTTARYSLNRVATGNFETPDTADATLPQFWTRDGSTSATAFRTNTAGNYVAGDACSTVTWGLQLTTAGGTAQRLKQTLAGYDAGLKHQLSFSAKNSGSTVHGQVIVYDTTDSVQLASIETNSTSWKSYSTTFMMPAAGHVIEIRLGHAVTSPASHSVYFDNVAVTAFHSYHILDGMIGIPAANFVRLVNRDSASLSGATVTQAGIYRTFLEDHVIAKWEDSGAFYGNTWHNSSSTTGYYKEPTNYNTFLSNTAFDPLPYNQYFALIEVQRILYDLNTNAAYKDKADKGATYFRNNLTTTDSNTVYMWYYAGFAGSKIEDASHSNVDMEFITAMHVRGDVFTGDDMKKFTKTLTAKLWNGSLTPPKLNNQVTGDQGTYCTNYLFSDIMYGWVPYAQFDPLAWEIAARQYAGITIPDHTAALTLSQIMLWDPVKLTNQGFELVSPDDPTLPARWTRSLSTSTTAYRDSTEKKSGAYGLTLITNGTSWQKLVQPWKEFVPSVSYTVTFDGKADNSGANGRVIIYNETTSSTIASYNFTSQNWTTYSFTFTAPGTATDAVKIQLGHFNYQVSNGKTHYDNVSIKRSGDSW